MIFEVAGPADEGEVRRLLRENPLGGRFPISLEREPNGFGGPHLSGERSCFILAREESGGPAVGLCERVVRRAFVDGEERLLPYLGALRVAESHRRRIKVLKGGFAALRDHAEQPDECRFALTSITVDNSPARRVLTAGLSGLPIYRTVGGYATLILRPKVRRTVVGVGPASEADIPEIAAFLREGLRHRQFAPCWSDDDLRSAHFLVARSRGRITGCISLWDQRASRQAVVRGYPKMVEALRPAINLVGQTIGIPHMPPIDTALSQAYLSHLVVHGDDPGTMISLVRAGLDLAARRGVSAAVLGLPTGHPWRPILKRKFKLLEYLTELYLVHWPEDRDAAVLSRDFPVFPEVGLL